MTTTILSKNTSKKAINFSVEKRKINFSVLEEAYNQYNKQNVPFLLKLRKEMREKKPYAGLKIFHNIPLTMETVLKVIPLIEGGADVTVSNMTGMPPQEKALDILKRANVKVQLSHDIKERYDVYLDCGAELVNAPAPKLGTIELTGTGTIVYKKTNLSYSVISVDDSKIKFLEGIGTGDSGVKAITELTGKPINNKKFLVFGYGKIGNGVVKSLLQHTKNVVVIDTNSKLIDSLNSSGIKAINANKISLIKKELTDTFCAITSTAVKGCISKNFDSKDFNNIILANLGAEDEFGNKFKQENVLNKKFPVNFAIKEPTTLRFLDPVFYAHNKAIDLLINNKTKPGYHPYSEKLSIELIKQWQEFHPNDPLFSSKEISKLINKQY